MKTRNQRYKESPTQGIGALLIIVVLVGAGLLIYWIILLIIAQWDNIVKSITGIFVPHL